MGAGVATAGVAVGATVVAGGSVSGAEVAVDASLDDVPQPDRTTSKHSAITNSGDRARRVAGVVARMFRERSWDDERKCVECQ